MAFDTYQTNATVSFNKDPLIEESKNWYLQKQFEKLKNLQDNNSLSVRSSENEEFGSLNVIPVWAKAATFLYEGSKPVVIIPFAETNFFKNTKYKSANLIIFKDDVTGKSESRILVFQADSTKIQSGNTDPLDVKSFTGIIYQVNTEGRVGIFVKCENGNVVGKIDITKLEPNGLTMRDDCPNPSNCPRWGKTFWQRVGSFLSGLFGGSDKNAPSTVEFVDVDFSRNILNIGQGTSDPNNNSNGSTQLSNSLSDRTFSNVSNLRCGNSEYDDILNVSVSLADDQTLNSAPAMIVFKKYGHNWANVYLNSAKEYYTGNYSSFGSALKYVESTKLYNSRSYASGISPNSSDPFVKAAYMPLISAYDAMLSDYNSHGGDCNSFNHSLEQSFQYFDSQYKNNYFDGYSNAGFTRAEYDQLVANPKLFMQVDEFLNRNGKSKVNIDGAKLHASLIINDSEYSSYNLQQNYNPDIINRLINIYTIKPPFSGGISNINEYLKCFQFQFQANYKITIAVDQPLPGKRDPYATNGKSGKVAALKDEGNIDVGHTFLILEQERADGTKITRSLGFYPNGGCSPNQPNVASAFFDDSNHKFDIGTTFDVDATKFSQLLDNIKSSNSNYDLNSHNCTGFVLDQVQKINIILPKTIGQWPMGSGLNPGDLGEDIRASSGTKNRFPFGIAPLNQGTCN